MRPLSCAAARRRLQAFHDRELDVRDQIAVGSHLEWCDHCAAALAELGEVRTLLQACAASRPAYRQCRGLARLSRSPFQIRFPFPAGSSDSVPVAGWRRRHRADQVSLDQHIALHGEFRSNGDTTPDRVLAQKELAERLQQALDQLPFDQRTAIVLREIDGLSYDEIAFSLGVAIGTVKSRLTRARQSLRLELREARTA